MENRPRLSDPKDKQRSKVPPVSQYNNEAQLKEMIQLFSLSQKGAIEVHFMAIRMMFQLGAIIQKLKSQNLTIKSHWEKRELY